MRGFRKFEKEEEKTVPDLTEESDQKILKEYTMKRQLCVVQIAPGKCVIKTRQKHKNYFQRFPPRIKQRTMIR